MRASQKNLMIATAESCTGGMISAALTDIPGSSSVFTHGFVTYANEAKEKVLGVSGVLLIKHGAVSAAVASAMARGALKVSKADIAVAVTGVAGPGGGTPEKPVGLVYIAIAKGNHVTAYRHRFSGISRRVIRIQTTKMAVRYLNNIILA